MGDEYIVKDPQKPPGQKVGSTIKFDECSQPKIGAPNVLPNGDKYLMEVKEIRLGNALFNRKLVKSLFFVGEPIQICMSGTFRRSVPNGVKQLQSSVHGYVKLVGDLIKIKYTINQSRPRILLLYGLEGNSY